MSGYWRLKGCLKCGGDIKVAADGDIDCLQCGYDGPVLTVLVSEGSVAVVAIASKPLIGRNGGSRRRNQGAYLTGLAKRERDQRVQQFKGEGMLNAAIAFRVGVSEGYVSLLTRGLR